MSSDGQAPVTTFSDDWTETPTARDRAEELRVRLSDEQLDGIDRAEARYQTRVTNKHLRTPQAISDAAFAQAEAEYNAAWEKVRERVNRAVFSQPGRPLPSDPDDDWLRGVTATRPVPPAAYPTYDELAAALQARLDIGECSEACDVGTGERCSHERWVAAARDLVRRAKR